MVRPVLLTVDDDPEVLQAIAHDLQQYGNRFRAIRADSGKAAFDVVQQLKGCNEPVAWFFVDQRMPQMSGIEFLEQAMAIFPNAQWVLLTAYAATAPRLDALTQSDQEDRLCNWLDDRDVANGWQLAPILMAVGIDGERAAK